MDSLPLATPWFNTLLVGVPILLAALAILLVVRREMPDINKIVWAIVIVALPVFGPLLYLLTRLIERSKPHPA